MSTKNKKGKKGKNKNDKNKLLRVDETFYQLTVADCENKIANLRKHLEHIDATNDEMKEVIRSLKEDHVDKAAIMTRDVKSIDEKIYHLSEKIYELSQEYFEVKTRGDATICDWEDKYKAMHDQLTAEIKILKSHLNMLQEYPKIEERLNLVNELEDERKKEKEKETKDAIHQMECRIKGERETMRKEIERKMLRVSEEFTRSSSTRNAAYTQRLIRENIALEKEIKILDTSYRSMEQHLNNQIVRYKEVKATFPELNEKKRKLILVAQQKTNLIEELTSKYEKLRNAYVESLLYKNQYQDLIQYQLCGHHKRHELIKEAKKLGTNAHTLKTECIKLGNEFDKNKREIDSLKSIISLIRKTILKSINVYDEKSEEKLFKPEDKILRNIEEATILIEDEDDEEAEDETEEEAEEEELLTNNLLETLYNILHYYNIHKISTCSIQTIPADHLLIHHKELQELSSDSVREVFKHKISEIDGADKSRSDDEHLKITQTVIIPKERLERCQILDIEKGSSYYASVSESKHEVVSVEERPEDDDFQQSSSSYSAISSEAQSASQVIEQKPIEKLESKTKISLSELPPGTIVDVEMVEDDFEGEEEFHQDDDIYLRDNPDKDFIGVAEEDEGEEEEMSHLLFY